MTPQELRDHAMHYDVQIENAQVTLNSLKESVIGAERNLNELKRLRVSLGTVVCSSCKGHGKLREWLAQDESKIVDCDVCHGSGLA